MRASVRSLLTLVAAALPSIAVAQKTVITLPGATANPNLSAGVRVGDMLYASGQLGVSRTAPDTTIEGQTKVALENVKTVMEAGGTSMANVVKCTVFLTRFADFQGMNRTYRDYFPKDPPARSTVIVAALVSAGALVEIECMAAIPR
jgi:2-iminobutanoate/2-iminopropanoate deaminase